MRGLTTVEALLIAAAFIIVGVIGLLTFQNMGKSAAESLRANAIATADRAGFDVTIEVLNGRLNSVRLSYGQSGGSLTQAQVSYCILPNGQQVSGSSQFSNPVVAGQSVTCRFSASLTPGTQYTYVIYAVDTTSGKVVQIAKGVVTAGIS
jgi:Tfp pilus assembly protein PilV